MVTMIDLNQYAIASRGELLTVRCSGRTEQHVNIPRGAHNITCLRPCTIVGAGWTITCIDRLYLARRYVMPVVQVTAHFNFSNALTEAKLQIALPQLKSSILPQLIQTEIGNIMDPISILPLKLVKNPFSLLSYINLALVLIFWSIIGLAYIRWRRFRAKLRITAKVPEIMPLQPTLQPDTAPTVRTCLWPILPTISDCASAREEEVP